MSKAREWPGGWQKPGPRAVQNLQMPHTPWTDKACKCPTVARGEGGGSWEQVELTDALNGGKRYLISQKVPFLPEI